MPRAPAAGAAAMSATHARPTGPRGGAGIRRRRWQPRVTQGGEAMAPWTRGRARGSWSTAGGGLGRPNSPPGRRWMVSCGLASLTHE